MDQITEIKTKLFKWQLMLLFVTVFQIFSASQVVFAGGEFSFKLFLVFTLFIALEWVYFILSRLITKRTAFELEIIAFLLSGISIVISASINDGYALKQLIAVALGVVAYILMLLILRDTEKAMLLRVPAALAAAALLALNLILAKTVNGTLNWIDVGGFSIQPSELVKVAFIFVGAVTLDKLQLTNSLSKYLVFSVICIGALFLMRDFGTALIFFFTFVIIAFMRSGDIRTIFLICTGAILGAMLIIYFKPYVATRFETYRHIWEFADSGGYQQTRVLIYTASGGLFGLGIGQGKLRDIYAASTDLVFGVICEEWGMLLGILILLAFAFIAVYAIRAARRASSSFYAIAAVAAAGMLLFQVGLNVFGITDLLPLTGVTLPFISRGGTSMICSWALLAFLKCVVFYRNENNEEGAKAEDVPIGKPLPESSREKSSGRDNRSGRGAAV